MTAHRAPASLTVDQCRDFYRSKTMGDTLKIEFWCFRYDLWRETWGKALGDLIAIPIGDKMWGGAHHDLQDSWEEGRILAAHRLNSGAALFTVVYFTDELGAQLAFSVWKPSGQSFANMTADIKINGTWKIDPDAEVPVFRTPAKLVMASDKDTINLEKLHKPAQDAVKAVLAVAKQIKQPATLKMPGKAAVKAKPRSWPRGT